MKNKRDYEIIKCGNIKPDLNIFSRFVLFLKKIFR